MFLSKFSPSLLYAFIYTNNLVHDEESLYICPPTCPVCYGVPAECPSPDSGSELLACMALKQDRRQYFQGRQAREVETEELQTFIVRAEKALRCVRMRLLSAVASLTLSLFTDGRLSIDSRWSIRTRNSLKSQIAVIFRVLSEASAR